jgi:hypothetical protein
MTGRFGGKGDNQRMLSALEITLIKSVFKTARLPRLDQITIGDGESATGTAWTASDYMISVGPSLFTTDLSRSDPSTLVHEMTHIWQYYNGTLTMAHAFKAQAWACVKDKFTSFGNEDKTHFYDRLYSYDVVDGSWDDMGFEGQAQMVEDWYKMGMKEEGYRFVFVKNILYDGDVSARPLTRTELMLRSPNIPDDDYTRGPDRKTTNEVRPPLTDGLLIDLLQRRYAANDVPGYGARERKVEEVFKTTNISEAIRLFTRLTLRNGADKVATYFHDHLSTASRTKLLQILQQRSSGK